MRYPIKYKLTAILIAVSCFALAQQSKDLPLVRIAKFHNDFTAAICYSFDDGLKDQAVLAVPMLDKFGFKATFFVIPSVVSENETEGALLKEGAWGGISWVKLKEMSSEGHEIANHSFSHKNMKTLSDSALAKEIDQADKKIFAAIGQWPLTFAYPYNSFDERVHNAVRKSHIAAREFQFGIGSHFTTLQGNLWADGLIQKKDWGITMIHGIAKGFDPLPSPNVLYEHFKYVKETGKIWVSTFSNITKYVHERDSSQLQVLSRKNVMKITLTNKLDTSIYNYPLTIVIERNNAVLVEATQGRKPIPFIVSENKIIMEAVPNSKAITLKWK